MFNTMPSSPRVHGIPSALKQQSTTPPLVETSPLFPSQLKVQFLGTLLSAATGLLIHLRIFLEVQSVWPWAYWEHEYVSVLTWAYTLISSIEPITKNDSVKAKKLWLRKLFTYLLHGLHYRRLFYQMLIHNSHQLYASDEGDPWVHKSAMGHLCLHPPPQPQTIQAACLLSLWKSGIYDYSRDRQRMLKCYTVVTVTHRTRGLESWRSVRWAYVHRRWGTYMCSFFH